MPMKGLTKCSVHECPGSAGDYNNLCPKHGVPGAIVTVGQSTMVVSLGC